MGVQERFFRSSGGFLGVQELQEYRSSDNSLGDGMQETGVQTIVWEAEYRRTDNSLGDGMQEFRQ